MSDRVSVSRRPISCGSAAYTGTASTAVVAPNNATAVFVWTTTDACVSLRPDATAATTANGIRLPAYTAVYLDCQPGDNLSAIRAASDGTLSYSWMT